jgi:hypothetical protein
VQAELAVAKKFEAETVTEFRASPIGGVDGDIDVVTNVRAYEVKAGNPSNLNLVKFDGQLTRLVEYANVNGKTPVVAIKPEFFPLNKGVTDLLNKFGVVVESY